VTIDVALSDGRKSGRAKLDARWSKVRVGRVAEAIIV